jgi:dTDP-4-amino-4,6-dideoxygalactose transaminase/RimJ/RimL family protein N-acetyltransferase
VLFTPDTDAPARRARAYALPFQRPALPAPEEIERYFAASRSERWYSNSGPCHELLVERAGALLGGREVVPVSSAGIGLIVALRALVPLPHGSGHQVLLPSFTFAATAAAVVWCGLEPVFCDIEGEGWHLCPSRLHEALAARQGRVAAIVACSAFGTPPPRSVAAAWSSAAEEWGIPLIVDSAAGLGAPSDGRPPAAEVFSMHATKPMPVGEGGLVALRDPAVAADVRTLINHGVGPDHQAVMVGLNGKLDEWHAATALAGLDRLDESLAARRARAATMRGNLSGAGLRFQAGAERSPAQFVPALLPSPEERTTVLDAAEGRGVEMRTYYSPPLHRTPAYRGCDRAGALAVTNDVAGRILSLPMAEDLSELDQSRVADCFRLRLRLLEPGDEPALATLFAANNVDAVTRWFDPFPLVAGTARGLSNHRGRDLHWGAWVGADLVGLAMVRGWDGDHPHPAYGCLVDRRRQHMRIGTTVTRIALEELRRRGVPEVRARVHDANEASLRMHRASGFEELERGAGRVLLTARPLSIR